MKIHRIHLKNYKCFEDNSFELNPRFTVLIGDNGKGKTAILDTINALAGVFLKSVSEVDSLVLGNQEIRLK
ncbi:MAG: AAA family ATPase, partial [Bacteroidota bacterium]